MFYIARMLEKVKNNLFLIREYYLKITIIDSDQSMSVVGWSLRVA
jgi:hypothetical protein